jgi:hypothetical protein
MRSPRRHSFRGAAVAALLVFSAFALAACGSSSTRTPPPARAASVYQRLVGSYVAYAQCARSHGMPDLPDPQVDDQGNDRYPSLDRQGPWTWPASVIRGCAHAWDTVHAIRNEFDSQHGQSRPPSVSSRAELVALARCIRRHGFPSYPDPGPTGSSARAAVPPGFVKPNLSAQALAAIDACRRRGTR